jgi:two-component system NtrC family sensor kinase
METTRWKVSLGVKLLVTVCGVAALSIGILAWMTVRSERAARLDLMIRGANQFSDTVKRSIHYAMLQNRWEDAFQIMDTIGKQEEVARVRVFTKEGAILFSTDRSEVGKAVDKRAESCYACHAAERPLERLTLPDRARVFRDREERRLLGMITPLYNEVGCSEGCHVHAPSKRVLGVLDITLSLDRVDAEIAAFTRRTVILAGATVLLLAVLLMFLVRRQVLRPVRDLVKGTRGVTRGEFGYRIPIRSTDEIGELAMSFNQMEEALGKTRGELNALVETLEQRVDERTRQLRETQNQLIQTEKLASLGKLSASIAHEINNPLSGILTYAKLISRRLRTRPPDSDDILAVLQQLALVERETQRCTAIVRNLLDFARQREPSFQEVNMLAVVDEALSLVANRLALQKVRVVRDCAAVPPVRADYGQMRQAVVNILLNACEAMPNGGTLSVSTRRAATPDTDVGRSAAGRGDVAPLALCVEVIMADQGEGIPPENLSRIFDPFFTTKEKGTGLGLSVVYGIMEKHGGKIVVESRVAQGTTVTLRLPAVGTGNM